MTHAVVVAAGRGSRLRQLTTETPKPLVRLAGRTILDRNLESLATAGIRSVTVVTGYRHTMISEANLASHGQEVHLARNPNWETSGIVGSFLTARPAELDDDILLVYGDIVFEPSVIAACLTTDGRLRAPGVTIPINTDWERLWRCRMHNIFEDAESLRLDFTGRVLEIGKPVVDPEEVHGQFMGIVCLTKDSAREFVGFYNSCLTNSDGLAPHPRVWDTTRLLTAWIGAGYRVGSAAVHGGWLEVDTLEDLATYERLAKNGTLKSYCALT